MLTIVDVHLKASVFCPKLQVEHVTSPRFRSRAFYLLSKQLMSSSFQ